MPDNSLGLFHTGKTATARGVHFANNQGLGRSRNSRTKIYRALCQMMALVEKTGASAAKGEGDCVAIWHNQFVRYSSLPLDDSR